MIITSPHNETLKQVRKLAAKRERDKARLFVAEGEDLLDAADHAGWEATARLCVEGSGLPGIEVEPDLLNGVSQLGSGTRTLAIYEQRWHEPGDVGGVTVHLHGVHDPGNVGTVLRSAHAFGATAVSIGPGTADPFGPKAVRASMGAIFTTPLVKARGGVGDLPGTTVALVARVGTALPQLAQKLGDTAVTLLVGAEREGLPEDVVAACDHVSHIPIEGESLNAAMAASVALYELRRIHMVTSDE